MKLRILPLVLGALALTAASAASARVVVSIGVNPYGYGAYAPPVVYQPNPYYSAPPIVYYGSGYWGNGHGRRSRSHDNYRNGRDRRYDGDHRDGHGH